MKITNIYQWSRRDFNYDAKCEGCGNEQKHSGGYDDANYYDNVIPAMKCRKCGESTNSLGTEKEKIVTRYNPNIVM